MFDNIIKIENQRVLMELPPGIDLCVKREDLLHAEVSGNKFRKLKYNFKEALAQKAGAVLTFGGAYSNHIAATAAAGRFYGLPTVGVIRGEELEDKYLENATLRKAQADGMSFEFVTRASYRNKDEADFLAELRARWGDFYLIPEGGTNSLAVKGCEEILQEADAAFDYICCAVGTGGTISGLINAAKPHQTVLGFPALKGSFLSEDIRSFVDVNNWKLVEDYHFGGYAKSSELLLEFIEEFYAKTQILLDPVYTGKMLFGVVDLIRQGYFKTPCKILAIHTGGLQGWSSKFKSNLVK